MTEYAEPAFTITEGQLVSLNEGRPQYAYFDAHDALLALCRWNDANGDWIDYEGDEPKPLDAELLLEVVNQWCAEDSPFVQNRFDAWLGARASR